jgi:hypothetical protein
VVSQQDVRNNAGEAQMKPFDKGVDAFKKGKLGNPYRVNTSDHRDWEYGFNKAYFANLKRVQENENKIRNRSRKIH